MLRRFVLKKFFLGCKYIRLGATRPYRTTPMAKAPTKSGAKKVPRTPVKRKSAGTRSWKRYLHMFLRKDYKGEIAITKKGMMVMNSMVNDIVRKIGIEAADCMKYSKKVTLSEREVSTAVKLIFPNDMAEDCNRYVTEAVVRYTESIKKSKDHKEAGRKRENAQSSATRAGLIFPPSRAVTYLRDTTSAKNIAKRGGVAMAAVLEHISSELFQGAVIFARESKKVSITPRFITLGIRSEESLAALFKNITFSNGGVLPFINRALLQKPKKTTKTRKSRK